MSFPNFVKHMICLCREGRGSTSPVSSLVCCSGASKSTERKDPAHVAGEMTGPKNGCCLEWSWNPDNLRNTKNVRKDTRQIQHHAKGETCTYDTFKTWWIFLDLAWCFRYGGIYSSRCLLKSLHHEAPASASKEMSETRNQEVNNDILRWTNYRCNMEMFATFNKKIFSTFIIFLDDLGVCERLFLDVLGLCFSSQLPRVQSM